MKWKPLSLLLVAVLLSVGCSANRELSRKGQSAPEQETETMPSPEVLDHVIAGSIYEMESDYLRALNEYNQALLRDSTQVELYHAIAEMYEQNGELDSARLILERALRSNPDDPDLLDHYGEVCFLSKRYGEALSAFLDLAKIDPTNVTAWANLAALYERVGRPMEAVASYKKLIELDPSREEVILGRIGSLLTGAGKVEKAIQVYRRLEELRPEAHMLPFMIGGLYLEKGDTLRADSAFTEASQKQPLEPRYWELRIRLAAIRGDSLESMALCDSALSYLPQEMQVIELSASVFMRFDQFDRAEEVLKHAVHVEPDNPEHLINLGFLYHEQQLWDKAEEVYGEAYKLAPEDPQVLNNYAYMLVEADRRLDDALAYVNTALEAEPDNASYLDTKGWILYKLGHLQEGKLFLERALQLDAENAEILDHLGDLYFSLGENQQAKHYWTAALEKGGDADKIGPKLDR